ncbi:squalene/phytoene synthase family protein [Roseobacter sp. YSTF-M11]|uniref:Squalene/phytoene synthase family protein n=1 Tax=Roseobacter insulae TaxID=2859783 RepID=A0A9X1K202_9RHOB|nr:squalene/phytoene synthase family protein [Roseobacter insulae]MBW4708028.1 squalene/phytoene synthase family protein [Roseobacter insulae]
MTFDADLNACASLVEKGDPDRFAATMASPVAARRVLFPLYAFNVEVSRAPWVTQETMIAEMRLQWWRDALEEIGSGVTVRRHSVVSPLADILDAEGARTLDRLIAARRWDIYREAFEDAAHFKAYLTETAAGLMWVAMRALTQAQAQPDPEEESGKAVRRLGYATGLARFLQAVPALEAQGRIPLVDGRSDGVAALARSALADCGTPAVYRRLLARPARPALTEAFLTKSILTQVVRTPQRVAQGTLAVSPLRRSYALWRWV